MNNVSNMNVKCNNVEISSKSEVKYVGAMLNKDMSGQGKCITAIMKLNSNLKCLYRSSDFFNINLGNLFVHH